MKKKLKNKRKRRRTRKKRGSDYSALAKKTIRRNAEKVQKERKQEKFNAKVKKMDNMTPEELMRKKTKKVSLHQVEIGKNLPNPLWGGGRSRKRKRKRKSRRKRHITKKK
tara:strand:+ start:316 stop:645 length:330 start_codon:yes stop_codon:yes gene_type:complete